MDILYNKPKPESYFKPLYEYLLDRTKDLAIPDSNTRDFFIECLQKYSILIILTILILVIIYFASKDVNSLTTNLYLYYIAILVPLIAAIIFLFPLFRNFSGSPLIFLFGVGFVAFFIGMLYLYIDQPPTKSTLVFTNGMFVLLFFLAVLVGLAIFYKVFLNYLNRQTGWLGFFIQFLFYLPCLISDFLTRELKTTPNVVFVLFILEIVLILLYFYLPHFLQKITINRHNVDLFSKSLFLNTSKTIGKNETFRINNKNKNSYTFRKNYAFSMWIYVNPQQSSYLPYSIETNIFDYGNGKPSIKYNGQNQTGKYRIQYSNNAATDTSSMTPASTNSDFLIDLPNQKWNYIVFNVNENTTDLFINGKLIKTIFTHKNNIATFSELDTVTVGDDHGVDGAICNIKYYKIPLSKYEISNSYNLLMYKNPPTQ
jgi:hypothetical protein